MASSTVEEASRGWTPRWSWPVAFVATIVLAALTFLLLPWTGEGKALAALHGLCAQQPDHTFMLGDRRLPFDARMTGIYGGAFATFVTLCILGRHRAGRLPTWPLALVAVAFVALMGIDGLNSTAMDLRGVSLYTPHNLLRLVTGLLTGITLASLLMLLLAETLWQRGLRKPVAVLNHWRDFGWLLLAQAPLLLMLALGWSVFWPLLTLLMLVTAAGVMMILVLVFVLLMTRRENRARSVRDIAAPATIALWVAFVVIGSLAGGRFLLESTLGISTVGGA